MRSRFNKAVTVALLSSLTLKSVSALQPKPARAMAAGGAASAAGFIMLLSGLGMTGAGHLDSNGVLVMTILLSGGILLDGQQQTVTFTTITEDDRAALGLSADSAQLINDNLDELNAIASAVGGELRATERPSKELSKAMWDRNLASLDADAQVAFREYIAKIDATK
jgi:hypothetical protein